MNESSPLVTAFEGGQTRRYELRKCPECLAERMVRKDSKSLRCTKCTYTKFNLMGRKATTEKRSMVTCEFCKTTFHRPPANIKTKIYCSRACQNAANRWERNCQVCGVLFQIRKSMTVTSHAAPYGKRIVTQERGFFCSMGCWVDSKNGITGRRHKMGEGKYPVTFDTLRCERG